MALPGAERCRLVALTGLPIALVRDSALREGVSVTRQLLKPVLAEALVEAIESDDVETPSDD